MIKFDSLHCEITLLSIEEYESMKDHIPPMNEWWWLLSPGDNLIYVANVRHGGSVFCNGLDVILDSVAVRPALKSEIFTPDMVDKEVSVFGNRWTVCGEGYAISNSPIGYHRFDERSNNYETSEIKKWIEDWKAKYEADEERE